MTVEGRLSQGSFSLHLPSSAHVGFRRPLRAVFSEAPVARICHLLHR